MVQQVQYELVLIIGLAVAGLVWLGRVPTANVPDEPPPRALSEKYNGMMMFE